MRTFLGWVVLVTILGAIAFALAPNLLQPLIVEGVRAASPFGSEALDVDVSLDTVNLLRGTIDRVHVTGANLATDQATIGSLDLTASDVSIGDHAFASIEGSLGSVVLRRPGGTSIAIDRVDLSGPSDAVDATASIGRTAAVGLVSGALTAAGLPPENVELVDGGVRLQVLGQRTDIAIGVLDGSLTIAGSLAGGQIVLFGPAAGDPWRITSVTTSPNGLQVQTVADLAQVLLRSR
jgi:hypothetical protein